MRNTVSLALVLALAATPAFSQTTSAPAPQSSTTSSTPQQQGERTYNEDPVGQTPSTQTTPTQTSPPQEGTAPVTDQPISQQPGLSERPAQAGVRGMEVPAGTEIRAALDTPLSSKTSQPGDCFTATLSEPVRGANGEVLVPTGAKIQGEVTQAEEGKTLPVVRGKGQLNMRFHNITLANGTTVPLTATLKSVHDTKGEKSAKASTGEEGQVESRTSGTEAAKNVGIGAAIGTVAGLVFGSPLKGLAIGAIAGGGYVLATKGKDVELPAQTGLRLTLDRPLTVPASTATR